MVSAAVRLRYDRQKQDGNRVGDGGGKENQGQRHPRQYAIDAQSPGVMISVTLQALGNVYGLNTLQKIDQGTVQGKRNSQGKQPSGFLYVGKSGLLHFLDETARHR